jgi:hypothetical protein
LKPDLRPYTEHGGWREHHGLTPDAARELATLASWLFLMRPVGCPIRAGIAPVLTKLRAIVGDPRVQWALSSLHPQEDETKEMANARAILELVGGKSVTFPKDDEYTCLEGRDDGTLVVGFYKNDQWHRLSGAFRPGKLETSTRKKIEQVAQALEGDDEDGADALRDIKLAAMLRSDGFGAFVERVDETEVPERGYEANPLVSVPKLVAKVAKAQGISADAAALYLQTLALAEPTQRNVALWNAWKPKQYAVAAAELAKKKLVVEGKRERAGRTIFLKGGYSKGSGKDLPMEEWKQSFYTVLERQLPTEPAHLLFSRAWKRVEDGDKP